jgi:hypothetical protein
MKKEVADKWVTALRSGEYEQAKGLLKKIDPENGDDIGYCCLGVLCELAIEDGVNVKRGGGVRHEDRFDPEDVWYSTPRYDDNDALIGTKVMGWSEMRTNDGSFDDDRGIMVSLVNYNDGGMSFNEIADIIESNWERL